MEVENTRDRGYLTMLDGDEEGWRVRFWPAEQPSSAYPATSAIVAAWVIWDKARQELAVEYCAWKSVGYQTDGYTDFATYAEAKRHALALIGITE